MKLDFRTKLYLSIAHLNVVDHIEVKKIDEKIKFDTDKIKGDVYIFDSFKEYKNYYLMFLSDVDEELIKLAIIRKTKKGQIIVFRGICEYIIVKEKMGELSKKLTNEQIELIHSNDRITPEEKVEEWDNFDLCPTGDYMSSASNRCRYFYHNCNDCMMDTAFSKTEHEKINFKLINYGKNKC